MTLDEIRRYLVEEFAEVFARQEISVVSAADGAAVLRLVPDGQHLRPGGIVSGPTLMMLADAAAYAALLSLSAAAKMAVTANLSVTFLRAAPPGSAILQDARVLKEGRRLAILVCEARDEDGRVLAHTTTTYAMPSASE
jgi:uncharacterized protein (TIGR00369 family)